MTVHEPPFVSTDLRVLVASPHVDPASDILSRGRTYRRLDPTYYAWLRHKMGLAKSAFSRGRLPEPTFDILRDRFNALHDRAIALFGESALIHATWTLDPKTYAWPRVDQEAVTPDAELQSKASTPPPNPDDWSDHQFPKEPDEHQFLQPVRQSALDKVQAIRERALAMGWTDADLLRNRGRFRFPFGNDYGLVCFVQPDQTLGRVTPKAIEVICRAGHSLHHYHHGGLP